MGAMGAVVTDFAVKSVFLCMLARRAACKGTFTDEYRESRHWRAAIDRWRRFRAALTAGASERISVYPSSDEVRLPSARCLTVLDSHQDEQKTVPGNITSDRKSTRLNSSHVD